MKQLLLALAVLLAPAAFAFNNAPLRTPIEIPYIGFTAVLKEGRVVAAWKRYRRDDFSYYHLVKSSSDASPMYPETTPIYNTDQAGDTLFEDGFLAPGTWHYRLVVVSRYGDRWVSPVVTIVITPEDAKRAAPTVADFE